MSCSALCRIIVASIFIATSQKTAGIYIGVECLQGRSTSAMSCCVVLVNRRGLVFCLSVKIYFTSHDVCANGVVKYILTLTCTIAFSAYVVYVSMFCLCMFVFHPRITGCLKVIE